MISFVDKGNKGMSKTIPHTNFMYNNKVVLTRRDRGRMVVNEVKRVIDMEMDGN